MLLDTALSCCLLLLASGCSIYLAGKRSMENFLRIKPEIITASIGVLAINLRSTFKLLSPLYFHNLYPIHPLEIADESEEKIQSRTTPLFEKCCRIFSMSGLIYGVCEAHQNRKMGFIVVTTLISIEIAQVRLMNHRKQSFETLFHFLWILNGVFVGWMNENHYCSLAYIPYWIAYLGFVPEIEYTWSDRHIINNYMMMGHIFLMFEAIREAQSLNY